MKFTRWQRIELCKIFQKAGIINHAEYNYNVLINNIELLSNVSKKRIINVLIDYDKKALIVHFQNVKKEQIYIVSFSIDIIFSEEKNNYPREAITLTNRFNQNFSQFDSRTSDFWFFYHCLLLLEKLLNDRQYEEWIGDLEEALYKMYDQQKPEWIFHKEILGRTFDILKSAFLMKVNSLLYKKK